MKFILAALFLASCAHKPTKARQEGFAVCAMEKINLAIENWQNHPGMDKLSLTNEQLLHHNIMRCYREEK